MSGKFIAYVRSVFTFFYLLLISISFLLFMGVRERVNDICYDIAENISTKGIVSSEIFSYLESSLAGYGEYDLNITLEKNLGENTSAFYYGAEQVKDMPLSSGDRVTISAEDTNPSLFEKLTGTDLRVSAVKIAIVN